MTAALARMVLAASGILAAFVTLLPATIAALIALFDLGAHGVLGMSGALLGLAMPPLGGGGPGLTSYRGVEIDPARVAILSALRGLPPVGMILFALARPRLKLWAAVCSTAACLTAGWPAVPGLLACGALPRAPPTAGRLNPPP